MIQFLVKTRPFEQNFQMPDELTDEKDAGQP